MIGFLHRRFFSLCYNPPSLMAYSPYTAAKVYNSTGKNRQLQSRKNDLILYFIHRLRERPWRIFSPGLWGIAAWKPDRSRDYKRLTLEEKESRRWIECAEQAKARLSEAEHLVIIGDRESGIEGKTAKQKNPFPRTNLAWSAWIIARLGGWKTVYAKNAPRARSP